MEYILLCCFLYFVPGFIVAFINYRREKANHQRTYFNKVWDASVMGPLGLVSELDEYFTYKKYEEEQQNKLYEKQKLENKINSLERQARISNKILIAQKTIGSHGMIPVAISGIISNNEIVNEVEIKIKLVQKSDIIYTFECFDVSDKRFSFPTKDNRLTLYDLKQSYHFDHKKTYVIKYGQNKPEWVHNNITTEFYNDDNIQKTVYLYLQPVFSQQVQEGSGIDTNHYIEYYIELTSH
jgi:hypothetical protein